MPATSRTEPTSHGDPGRFFANHPPIVWPILGVLAVVVAIGMVGVYLVASNANDTNPRGDAQGVNVRGEQTAVANAGIGNGNTSVTVGDAFAPASLVVPRGTGDGIPVDFFGERTTLPAGPAMAAVRAGAPIIPVGCYFRPEGVEEAFIEAPLDTERRGPLRDDMARITQDLAHRFEAMIRRDPTHWHLLQPNWPSDRHAAGPAVRP